jgi:hypothetical protein
MGNEVVMFLDFDDVLCLNRPYGGYDAMLAMGTVDSGEKSLEDHADLWEGLFDKAAVAHLKAIHDEFEPAYVLSTSWIKMLGLNSLVLIMRQSGLDFVVNNLHLDWSTTSSQTNGVRAVEICGWLDRHPEKANFWLVLDDQHSGTGLRDWPVENERGFITLCRQGVGLTALEAENLRNGLKVRVAAIVA